MNFQELNMMLKEMDKIPFPKLENVKPNAIFGRDLYNSFAGTGGELTAIMQYINEHITYDDEVGIILLCIAIQEMKHLDILGDILVNMDMTPYYMGSRNNKWCSDNVKYHFKSIPEMMKYNILAEKEAIKGYKKLIEETDNFSIKSLIGRIIMDEENHIKVFTILEEKYR